MGFDGLKDLQEKMDALANKKSVSLSDLLSPNFMASCSSFKNAQELFDKSGFKIDSKEDFAAIPDDAWDKYISQNTKYNSWSDMQRAAHEDWLKRQF
jgi:hypothetical protein